MTQRDNMFAHEYIIDLNASAAAIRAGYSPKTAKDAAAWIREEDPKKPKVKELVDKLIAERSRRTGVTADRVLIELAKVAFANAGDIVDFETGKVRKDARNDDKAAIQSVSVKRGKSDEYDVRLLDKTRALELLGKHMGMFTDNVSLDVKEPVIRDDV